MKIVVLHLGTHKAASTSIQMLMAKNRQALKDIGICYPEPSETPKFAHHAIAWTYVRQYNPNEKRPANYSLDDAIQDFDASGCNTLWLSSEDFINATVYDGLLNNFVGRLRKSFNKVVVTAYVRNRKDFFTSSYNQWIKSLLFSGDFDSYFERVLRSQKAEMHYTKALDIWGQWADESVYLPFLPEKKSRSPEKQLLAELGYSDEILAKLADNSSGPLNASIGSLSILAFRRVITSLEDYGWFKPFDLEKRGILIRKMIANTETFLGSSPKLKLFNSERLAAMNAVFHQEDQMFSQSYFGEDWNNIFREEIRADVVNEKTYDNLNTPEKLAIDQFVEQAIGDAAVIFRGENGHKADLC